MQNLFAATPTAPGRGGNGNGTTILSFKAGKMVLEGPKQNGSYSVTADKRRGTFSLVRTNDQLVHFRVRSERMCLGICVWSGGVLDRGTTQEQEPFFSLFNSF